MAEGYEIFEIDDEGTEEEETHNFEPSEYGYLWIRDCCLMHQWCSGAREIDDEVIEYAESLANDVREDMKKDDPNWGQQDLDNLETLVRYLKDHQGQLAEESEKSFVDPRDGTTITYNHLIATNKRLSERREDKDQRFFLDLVGPYDIPIFLNAVNRGIDGHLEACFVQHRGDEWIDQETKVIANLNGHDVSTIKDCDDQDRIQVKLSPISMCTLLRRLTEVDDDHARRLVTDELEKFRIKQAGWVERT